MPQLPLLFTLYFAQGLPFGFQATALPLLLRERGVSLAALGFASLLSAPWLLKATWAPLVDRYGSARFGRRKSWIIPMQIGMAVSAVAAAQTDDPIIIALLVLVMNFFAATQDIAVDGLAVSVLKPEQLGLGNALQVVGYKLGMLTGGGLLVWASASIGVSGLFYAIAALMSLVMLVALSYDEREHTLLAAQPVPFAELFKRLGSALKRAESAAVIAVVLTYKMGESMADAMWKPLLLDRGFSTSQIGLWAGTFGMVASLLGSTAGGLLARGNRLGRALVITSALRGIAVLMEWWIAATPQANEQMVIGVTCVEHLLGGALTTVLFALMMRHSEREVGATHFTLLASLEVLGKLPLAALGGVIAQQAGYSVLFATATLLCVAFALLTISLRPTLDGRTQSARIES